MSGMISHVVVVLVAAGYVGAGGKARLEGEYVITALMLHCLVD